jgi:hypothetical protein
VFKSSEDYTQVSNITKCNKKYEIEFVIDINIGMIELREKEIESEAHRV